MAEYRGLTIRIGADASRFTAALRATQGAIADTQKNLNNLKKALQFDPGSKNASALYVGELQSQAVAAASKVALLRKEIENLKKTEQASDKDSTIGDLAEKTDNAALSAQRAREAFNDVNAALAALYTDLSERSHAMFDLDPEEAKEYKKAITDELVAANRAAIDERKKQIIEEQHLSESKAAALAKEQVGYLKVAEARKKAADIVSTMSTGETFNEANSDFDRIVVELERLADAGNITQETMDDTVMAVRRLKKIAREYGDALEDASAVDQIHKDQVEVAKLEAQIKSLAKEQVAASRNPLTDSLQESYDALKVLGSELDSASREFKLLDDAFKIDPTDATTAALRMEALEIATEAAAAKAEQLQQIIQGYEDAGIGDVVRQTDNLSVAAEEAQKHFEDTAADVIRLESLLDTTGNEMKEQRVDLATQSKEWLDNALAVGGLRKAISDMKAEMASAEAEHQKFQSALEMRDAIAQYNEVNNKFLEFQNITRDSVAIIQALGEKIRSGFSNELEMSLANSREELEGLATASGRAVKELSQIERASKLDPSNIDLIARGMIAADAAAAAAEDELSKVQAIISSYNAAGIDKIADSTPNLTYAIANAKEEARRASEALAVMKMSADDVDPEKVEQLSTELAKAESKLNELESAEGLIGMRSRAADLVNTITELRQKADTARSSLKAMGDSVVDAVKGGVEAGFGRIRSEFDALSDATGRAKTEFDALGQKLDLKPTSIELAAQRADALKEAIARATQEESRLDAEIQRLSSQGFAKILSETKDLATSMGDTEDKWRAAEQAVKLYEQRLSSAKKKVNDLAKAGKGVGDSEYDEAAADVARVEQQLNEATQAAAKFASQYHSLSGASLLQNLQDQRREVGLLKAEYESVGREGFNEMSTSLFLALQEVGQEAKQAFNSVVDTTTALDDALTQAKKTVNDLDDNGFEKLKDSAIELSKVQPIDAATILNAEALGGQLGFAATEVEEFARVATGLDVATNMSWEEASNNMARFFNIMDLGHDQVENYGSAIVELGNNYATTESEISDMAMRIAGAGAAMGLGAADILGLSTALTSVGLSAEAGGSSISQIMVKIDKAVANATDGVEEYASRAGMAVDEYVGFLRGLSDDQFADYAKSMGMTSKQLKGDTLDSIDQLQVWADTAKMTSEEFAEAWTNKPIDALTSVFAGLEKATEDEGSNLSLMLEELGITTIRQSDVARRLANSSSLLTKAVRDSNDAWADNSALSTEVARRNESLSAQMEILGNCFDAIKSELGEGLVPIVQKSLPIMQNLSTVLNDMPTGVKAALIGLTGLVGAFGTAYPAISQIAGALGKLNASMIASSPIYRVAATPVSALAGAIKGLIVANPAAAAVAALAAVVGGVLIKKYLDAKKAQDDFNTALERLGSSVGKASGDLDETIKGLDYVDARAKHSAKSIEELTDNINSFCDSQQELETNTRVTEAMLSRYKEVIDEVGGKYKGAGAGAEVAAEDQAILEWALKGVNDELGTSITLADILNGTYENEQGEIEDTIDALDRLIDARKRAARAEADQQAYSDSLRFEQTSALDVEAAKRELDKTYNEEFARLREKSSASMSDEAISQMVLEDSAAYKEAAANYAAAQQEYNAATTARQQAENQMANDELLAEANITVEDLYKSMRKLGNEAPTLANTTSESLSQMIQDANGNVDTLARLINNAGNEMVIKPQFSADDAREGLSALDEVVKDFPKSMMVKADADTDEAEEKFDTLRGEERDPVTIEVEPEIGPLEGITNFLAGIFGADNTEISFDVVANTGMAFSEIESVKALSNDIITLIVGADTSPATGAIGEVASYPVPDIMVEADAAVDSAVTKLESVTTTADGIPKSKTTTAYANVGSALTNLWSVVSAANSIPSYKSLTVSFQTSGYDAAMAKIRNFMSEGSNIIASKNFNAAGGIRYHADGMIVNRPTWLGTRDIVGEAGAEAIIPLTNRRYVQPFADAVAEGMGKQIGSPTTNNYYSINGLTVAPDSALARAMDATFDEAKRYSRMGRR